MTNCIGFYKFSTHDQGRCGGARETLYKTKTRDQSFWLEMPGLFSLVWCVVTDLAGAASGVVMVICCGAECTGIADSSQLDHIAGLIHA